jgi:hypothetical protein
VRTFCDFLRLTIAARDPIFGSGSQNVINLLVKEYIMKRWLVGILSTLSALPLLVVARQTGAETSTFTISPTSGASPLTTNWATSVTLTDSGSKWTKVAFSFDVGGYPYAWYSGTPDGVQTGPGTFLFASSITFGSSGTFACYCDDYGTDAANNQWHLNMGPVDVTVYTGV